MSYTLTFSQLIGEFITDKEFVGAQDPYVVFEAGGRKSQTKAIKSAGAGTCEWKETYTLNEFSPSSSGVLEVTVYNHNTLRPDGTLGSGTVNLTNLGESQLSGSGDRVTVPLTDKKGKNIGALKFIIHGGGYTGTGSGSRSTGSGSGYGTGAGVGAGGAGYGSGSSTGAGGAGYGSGSSTGGQVTGVGAGSNYGTAQAAADKAARENRDVTIQSGEGVAAGRPTNVGASTGSGYDQTATRGSGYDQTATRGTTTTGATDASGVRGIDVQPGEVIDRKYYTGIEDRPQEQALVEQYREHNPYAKQYETTVQHTGRERLVGSKIEALGTTERVVGTDHHVHAHPHDHIARALPKGAIAERPGGEGWVQGKAGPICDSSTFEVTGDRTVDKERVTNLREHREFEKEFEVKTALTGERNLERGAEVEQLNRERVLLDEKSKNACAGHPTVDGTTGIGSGVTGSGSGYGTGSGTGVRSTESGYGTGTGSGYGTGSGTGARTTESGYGTGTGSGYGTGSGNTGAGYGSGTGTGSGTGSGTGTGYNQNPTAGMSTTQKIASVIPGTEANKEKKAAQGSTY